MGNGNGKQKWEMEMGNRNGKWKWEMGLGFMSLRGKGSTLHTSFSYAPLRTTTSTLAGAALLCKHIWQPP